MCMYTDRTISLCVVRFGTRTNALSVIVSMYQRGTCVHNMSKTVSMMKRVGRLTVYPHVVLTGHVKKLTNTFVSTPCLNLLLQLHQKHTAHYMKGETEWFDVVNVGLLDNVNDVVRWQRGHTASEYIDELSTKKKRCKEDMLSADVVEKLSLLHMCEVDDYLHGVGVKVGEGMYYVAN